MSTLQDVSDRLMKPAKDLADWKFPLSEILEEYYVLLEEPGNVNFGEAALVLQNSANVYVRRVECLYSETEFLKHTFNGYNEEPQDDVKKSVNARKKSSQSKYVNLDDFALIDLEKQIGKNIDLKQRHQIGKGLKLLSRRFTQLESNMPQLRMPIEVFDVYGEVMGRKYDFRFSQSVNVNGMLVDELTLADFAHSFGIHSRLSNGRNLSSTSSESKNGDTVSSKEISSSSQWKSLTPSNDEHEDEPLESPLLDSEKDTPEMNNSSFQQDHSKESSESGRHLNDSSSNSSSDLSRSEKGSSLDNAINDGDWMPMPLTQGAKNSLSTDKSNLLKVTNYTSILNSKFRLKRKIASQIRKTDCCLAKFVLSETESRSVIDSTGDFIAPTLNKFQCLRKSELVDFMRKFDECFNAEEQFQNPEYEAITRAHGSTADLLGFRLSRDKIYSPAEDEQEMVNERTVESMEVESVHPQWSPNCEDSELSDDNVEHSTYEDSYLPDYQAHIKDKMDELLQESNVTTELEHTVAKWHATLQPKLSEAESRPAFRIRDYTSRVIGSLKAIEQRSACFDTVVSGKPAYEVARYFLASLQLANTYDVEIKDKNGSRFQIALLKASNN